MTDYLVLIKWKPRTPWVRVNQCSGLPCANHHAGTVQWEARHVEGYPKATTKVVKMK